MTAWTRFTKLHALRILDQLADRSFGVGLSIWAEGELYPIGSAEERVDARDAGFAGTSTNQAPWSLFEAEGWRCVAAPFSTKNSSAAWVVSSGFALKNGHLRAPAALSQVDQRALVYLDQRGVESLGALLQLAAEEVVFFSDGRAKPQIDTEKEHRHDYSQIIGNSPEMNSLFRTLDKVIDSDSTVLIQGENGTGKELIAKAIHYNSFRKKQPFVVQNCSAFNDNLLDSELFGHKKGAFTGAFADKRGLFEVADGGTFFLDEIGDMSPSLQVKLLRVLQEGTFMPVGDTQSKKVDVRIVAATNRDLKAMMEGGDFREDLYYRINVINITPPPLRDRRSDIATLVDYFLAKQSKNRDQPIKEVAQSCLERLIAYHWPGNVRELENEIERLVVMAADDGPIEQDRLSSRIAEVEPLPSQGDASCLPDAVMNLERNMIYEVLKRNQWNKTRAAQELQISRRNLIRKVQKYKLDPQHT